MRGLVVLATVVIGAALACADGEQVGVLQSTGEEMADPEDRWAVARGRMVDQQIAARGVRDPRVLAALRRVPRHEFVPEPWRWSSYDDRALPIGHDQTISQPYIVAAMTELAALPDEARVLEIGTGSGYQAAVLAAMGATVWTIEIVEPLARRAAEVLERLGYADVHLRHGDGFAGWPEEAPFDAIIVTAAPKKVPPPLLEQLRIGGRLVIPVGPFYDQRIEVHERTADGVRVERKFGVRFVPFVRGTDAPARSESR